MDLRKRFDAKWELEPETNCWLWAFHCTPDGYGKLKVNDVSQPAHRVAYELFTGPIPKGRSVRHNCEVRACVNPEHLFIGNRKEPDLRQRFNAKWQLDPATGCWLWLGVSGRYGTIQADGKVRKAHRVAYQLYRGPIPDDRCVLHSCDTPACVNPEHLFLGTHAENMADMAMKGRAVGLCGEQNKSSKLTKAAVKAILSLRESGQAQVDIAARFAISQKHVSRIWRGEAWSHLHEKAA